MEERDLRLEIVLKTLRKSRGVLAARTLNEEEKDQLLGVEGAAEEKRAFGMCKSVNKGIREALKRDLTVAMIFKSSVFQYPPQPYMIMKSGDQVVGELVNDDEKIAEMKGNPYNVFLWNNFVVYMKKVPRDPVKRRDMRVVYLPRKPVQLRDLPYVQSAVFGTLTFDGDALLKQMLDFESSDSLIGTGLIGFNIE